MAEDLPKVGRNDPCPCGSGKKYKKCHYKKDLVSQSAKSSTANLSEFLKPDDPGYLWHKGLRVIVNRRDWALLYEAFAPESPIVERFKTVEDFVEVGRVSGTNVPAGGEDYLLRRFRFVGDHLFVMGVRGRDDRRAQAIEYEVLACVKTDAGFRIRDMERVQLPKDTADDPEFERFTCVSSVLEQERAKPLVRPEFERWDVSADGVAADPTAAPDEGAELATDGDAGEDAEATEAPAEASE